MINHLNLASSLLSYFASENDVNVVLRGVRLLFKLARTEPLCNVLDLNPQKADKDSYFWPGDLSMESVSCINFRTCMIVKVLIGTCLFSSPMTN